MPAQNKHSNRQIKTKSFHLRYLELCRSKNYPVLPNVKAKENNWTILDFFGDKLKIDDWLLIINSLSNDTVLENIRISLRKPCLAVLENVDTEKKARMQQKKLSIATKFIFTRLVEAVGNCLNHNKNITSLSLEGLPLTERYLFSISQAVSSNVSLRFISFSRSPIEDIGCEIICNSMKHLPNVESVNLSQCCITKKGAASVAELIKFQKIRRFSELWMISLRYREVDPDSIRGIRHINLNHNSSIGDEGLILIAEVLKDDAWIKAIEMCNCGITEKGGAYILECAKTNKALTSFSVCSNPIGELMLQAIRTHYPNDVHNSVEKSTTKTRKSKILNMQEHIQLLEEKLAIETNLRIQAEHLNEQLNDQISVYQKMLEQNGQYQSSSEGYSPVDRISLDAKTDESDFSSERLPMVNGILRNTVRVHKAKSETIGKDAGYNGWHQSKSEHHLMNSSDIRSKETNIYIERTIGDSEAVKSWTATKPEVNEVADCSDRADSVSAKALFLGS